MQLPAHQKMQYNATPNIYSAVMKVQLGGRSCMKTEFFFRASSVPANYSDVRAEAPSSLPCMK